MSWARSASTRAMKAAASAVVGAFTAEQRAERSGHSLRSGTVDRCGHNSAQLPPLLALRQFAPPQTDVPATLRKVGTAHDQNEAFDQLRVVEDDVLGDQTAGRQAHEANLSEMVPQHLGVVRSQLFRVGWGGRTAPALDDVQRVLVRQSAEAMTIRARNQPARLLVVECHARQYDVVARPSPTRT